jgi:tetratricopeptide (TPR) repeat protein
MKKNLFKKLAKKTGTSGFVIFSLLFALGALQMRPAPDPVLSIEITGGVDGQFTLSEYATLSFEMSGAAPDSEYLYWVRIYTESGETLQGWRGTVITDSDGGASVVPIPLHRISLPLGQQYAEVTIPELGLESTYSLSVGGITEMVSNGHTCNYEKVTLAGILDRETVAPGDTLYLTVRIENNMDCEIKPIQAESLVVDFGSLGGKKHPLAESRPLEDHGSLQVQAEITSVPNLTPGTYPINIQYVQGEIPEGAPSITPLIFTWAAYVQVEVTPSGALSILSSPVAAIDRESFILLEVANLTTRSTVYTVAVTPPDGITLLNDPIITLDVPGQSAEQIAVPFIGEKEGEYLLNFTLLAGDAIIDKKSATIQVNPSGGLSVLSSLPVTKNREGSILLEVANPTTRSTAYTVVVTPPDGITLLNDATITLDVPGQSAEQIAVPFIGEKEGEYILNFTLLVGETTIDETSTTVQVTGFTGSVELVSPPSNANLNETIDLKFRVTNTSPVDTTYTLSAGVSKEFTITGLLSVSVPAGGTEDLSLSVTPAEKGPFLLTFDLFCEGDLVDSTQWNVTVEQGISTAVVAAVATVAATGAGAALAAKSALSKHGLAEEGKSTAEFQSGEEKARALQEISETTEEQGNLEESAELYEKTAEAWEQINRIEQAAEIYKRGADIHEKLKHIRESLKDREKAALLFEKAAKMAEESGSYEKAASLCEKAACEWQKTRKVDKAGQEFEKTAYFLNKAGNTDRAREVQEMAAHSYEEAASLGLEIKEFRTAGTFYEKAGVLYREAGKPHEASEVYNKAEDLWNRIQDPDRKKKTEETLGVTYEEEAKKAEEKGNYEKAALSYEKAADTWRKAGDQPRATQDEQKALELYDKMNR